MLCAAAMGVLIDYLIPILMVLTALAALRKRDDVYGTLLEGGAEGLRIVAAIVPSLVMLLSAFHMLRASGAIDLLSGAIAPAADFLGIPPQVVPLMLIRPISGSAALAIGADLIAVYGVDSRIGLTAAVMLGSSETTFYTISVYFGAANIRKTRYAIPAALCADLAGFLSSCAAVRWFFQI